jgi:thiol-disulfide isomerase/thioredoxin
MMRGTARQLILLAWLLAWIVILAGIASVAIWTFTPSKPKMLTESTSGDSGPWGAPFVPLDKPRVLPEIRFSDGESHDLSLSDFRGRFVLLNIWATWCIPCRKEMPSLDRLQAVFDASQLLVLPLSIDRGIPAVVRFYQELGLKKLGVYIDPSAKVARDLNVIGVPETLLVDRDGREIARQMGAVEWDSPAMVALVREHLGLPSGGQRASP